jgi:tetratricopeptide (TPR) repeat protein
MAECHWKAAQVSDILGEYLKAAESFSAASSNYRSAGQKIPQLKNFYQEQSRYMEAWSEIERARQHHTRQEYGLAEEHFEKAAEHHKSLKHWSYLAPNYLAWAQLEHAEDLSRKEQCEEAIEVFKQAANLFNETEGSLRRSLGKIEDQDEKRMATEMVKTTHLRHEYCIGRIALEEAKILEKNGDHYSSSEKYGLAAEIFQKTTEASISEQDRKEIKFVMALSQAWQRMTHAEAEESPDLFLEASQLFDNAKEFSPNEKARLLALGHSRFCRALEMGTRFADTREVRLHTAMMQHLESASNYYVKAGFQDASEYAKATKLLFDAYVHTDKAQREDDPEKKARVFIMAEKLLQMSADKFMRAEYPGKRDQVLRMLEHVKEQRELAVSLSEILNAPSMISATNVFSTPVPTQENAVGLERFEQADVQANVITHQKELLIGDNLDLKIDLVNAGKGSAFLTKITEIIPRGFELAEEPENCRVEDNHINLKGRRLEPLKKEEVRILLKPTAPGVVQLRPKILYLDENGKYKTHEPEPVTITVKELGIKGWLKGKA